ncbi:hypothetical protein QIW53_05505 [Pseudomonas fluorescens]|uniref:hypothetical protein n=1 Tax=Pseudomonas fluorescens TaxID=294 RepID=UPI003524CC3E
MSEDEVKGRNLILRGRFPSDWKTSWTHDGVGSVAIATDPGYGYYLMMNRLAKVTQVIDAPVFTAAQMTGVTYRIAFVYENWGDGANSKVVLTTGSGKVTPIDLSGKIPEQPDAEWNPYPYFTIKDMSAADRDLTVDLHGSDKSGSSALRITDIDVDVRLVPLVLEKIQLDDRVYEP